MQTTGEKVNAKKATAYITLKQASEQTQIPVKTLRKKISLGLLPAYKPGRSILIDPKELEVFVRKARKKLAS